MSYNTAKLKTITECNAAIELANERKTALLFSQTIQGKDLTDRERTVTSTSATLLIVKGKITGAEAALATIPEGKDKQKVTDQLRRLNDQRENLEATLRDAGNSALLDTELDSGLLRAQVAEIDTYLTEIEARKALL